MSSGQQDRRLQTGPLEARLLTQFERQGVAVVALPRPPDFLPDVADARFYEVLHRLAAKGWLLPIERGKCLEVPAVAHCGDTCTTPPDRRW